MRGRFLLALLACVVPGIAYAYIDPGSGSILIQVLIAALAAIGVFFGRIRDALRHYFTGRKKPKHGQADEGDSPR